MLFGCARSLCVFFMFYYRPKYLMPNMAFNLMSNSMRLRRENGQSLVEMTIALLVLVPLAVSVMLLGQFIHIKLLTQNAAREAAWQTTVDPALTNSALPSMAAEQSRLRQHQFSDATKTLQSGGAVPGQFADSMLMSLAGRGLLKPDRLTLAVYNQQSAPSYLDSALSDISNLVPGGISLSPNLYGLVTAEVHAKTEPIFDSNGNVLTFIGGLSGLRLDFSAKTVLLADAWDASGGGERLDHAKKTGGERSVRAIIQPLVPTEWAGKGFDKSVIAVAKVLGNLLIINKLLTPNFDYFEPGRTAPDVVPVDKLVK